MAAVATRHATELDGRDAQAVEPPVPRLFDPPGSTLEDAIVATWEELAAAGRATCPVCSGEMGRKGGCEACGAELS